MGDWSGLLGAYGRKHCLDVCDRVYGLNGLVSTPVQVDYGLHSLEVFAAVMKAEGDDYPRSQFTGEFAEVVWWALGLNDTSTRDAQLYSSLVVRVGLQHVWNFKAAEIIVHGMDGRRRKWKKGDSLFTQTAQRPDSSSTSMTPPTPLLVIPSMANLHVGNEDQTWRHSIDSPGIALTDQRAQKVPSSSLRGFMDSLVGAEVSRDSGDLPPGEATIKSSLLAYYHARIIFGFQPALI